MIRIKYLLLLCALAMPWSRVAGASDVLSMSGNRMILIVPARQRILQLGFDMLSLRPRMVLVSYQGATDGEEAGMHLWNGETWLHLSEQDYEDGGFLRAGVRVQQVYLIGPEEDAPWVLQYRPAWAENMHWIQSLHVPDLVNVLGERFRFTRQEWRRIAGWQDLRLYESSIPRRHVQREETWPPTPPDEARRPILERLRDDSLFPDGKRPAPAQPESEPWSEVEVQAVDPVTTPPSDPPTLPDLTPPAPEDAVDPEPAAQAPTTETSPIIIDPIPETTPEPEHEPEPEIILDVDREVPEVDADDLQPAPEPVPILEKGVRAPVAPTPVTSQPEAIADDGEQPDKPDDAPPAEALTPQEIEFFRLIRDEFPDLEDLPDAR